MQTKKYLFIGLKNDESEYQMEVKLIRENPDGSADFSFDLSDQEKEALLCLGILTGIKRGIEEGKLYVAEREQVDGNEDSSTLQTSTVQT